jgi:integrase
LPPGRFGAPVRVDRRSRRRRVGGWAAVDLDAGFLSIHRQLSRYSTHARLKTEAGRRKIVLAPAMVRPLSGRWLASSYKGLDVVFVSRHLGHADPSVTRSVYAHLFARAKHALAARSALEAGYATMALSRW